MSNQSLLTMPDAGARSSLVRWPAGLDETAELAFLFKILADPIRLRLLSQISAHEDGRSPGVGVCVCKFTGAFDVTAPTISHHLKVLRESGLLAAQRRGTYVYYWILPGALERVAGLFIPPPVASTGSF